METTVAPTDGRIQCSVCRSQVWRARFDGQWRLVELCGTIQSGRVSLLMPLPGIDAPILGCITRRGTPYKLHEHTAFSAGARVRKVRS